MKFSDLNIIKAHQEIEAIKSNVGSIEAKLDEVLSCLPEREKKILDAIELNKQSDLTTVDLIEKQQAAIAKLEALNTEKQEKITGMSKWLILGVLGLLSLTVRYSLEYDRGTGIVVRPNTESGPVLPVGYFIAIVAVATNHDGKLGSLIEGLGKKLGS